MGAFSDPRQGRGLGPRKDQDGGSGVNYEHNASWRKSGYLPGVLACRVAAKGLIYAFALRLWATSCVLIEVKELSISALHSQCIPLSTEYATSISRNYSIKLGILTEVLLIWYLQVLTKPVIGKQCAR